MEQASVTSQEDLSWGRYARAERFLSGNARKLIFRVEITPTWLGKSNRLFYTVGTRKGIRCIVVDPKSGHYGEAFDHTRFAAAFTMACGEAFTQETLPLDRVTVAEDGKSLTFAYKGTTWKCKLDDFEFEKVGPGRQVKPEQVQSPDKKWVAFVKDCNIYLRGQDGVEIALTNDGRPDLYYAKPFLSPIIQAGLQKPGMVPMLCKPSIKWSPDSKSVLTYRIDPTRAKKYHLLQSVPLDGAIRPKMFSYVHGAPGDEECALCYPVIIDIATKAVTEIDLEPHQQLYYGAPRTWNYWTKGDVPKIIWSKPARGRRALSVLEIDPVTGKSRTLFEENSPTEGVMGGITVLGEGEEIISPSQRDGWMHLYLYDGKTGVLKNRITSGTFVVRGIKYVDEAKRVLYFTACGREEGRDPYFEHLYSVNLDGSNLRLLTPEDAEHQVNISPSGEYFIDRLSRVDLPPKTILRDCEGNLVKVLEEADLELLFQTGWQFPERFCVKSRDGVTDIYGVIIRPSNFAPNKKYPVIEGNYSGPSRIRAPKAFPGKGRSPIWPDQALAELGFIVISVDGLGMAYRSLAFQDIAYKNLGDGGFPDHIKAFRELANKYPYMDLNRVGIYGGSAGGYGAARALLAHPDFYKVGVAWAGNHDHRIGKAGWVERYMGVELGSQYPEQSNVTNAGNLMGKLLIMHGDMDENVSPAASIQLIDALIKANKNFDFLLLPNGIHSSGGSHPYIVRRRWDYFVRHLLGVDPPEGYRINQKSL